MNELYALINADPFVANLFYEYAWIWPIVSIWSLVWKGLALWRAAMLKKQGWFVALLIVNTLGIFEIIFLLVTNKQVKTTTTSYE